jgi:hypothetical protein
MQRCTCRVFSLTYLTGNKGSYLNPNKSWKEKRISWVGKLQHWHTVTLKWIPIVFVCLIQSQCTGMAMTKYGMATVHLYHYECISFHSVVFVDNVLYL